MIFENASNMDDIDIQRQDEDERYPVYCWYDGQNKPQDAYIIIDPLGSPQVKADFNAEIGNGVVINHWEGKDFWLKIPSAASGHNINTFIDDNIELIRAVIDGYTEEQGFDNEAREAQEQLEREVAMWETSGIWDLPGEDEVDVSGRVIDNWEHTLTKSAQWEDEDGTHIEITYYDPYGFCAGGSEWILDENGKWTLENPNAIASSLECMNELDADDVREYVQEVYEDGEISAMFLNM